MGANVVDAAALTRWYRTKNVTDARPAVTVDTLAAIYIDEGRIEGVRGDVAFVQAMLETGWLRHSERVPPEYHNYSGIGAVDGGTDAARFPNARTGIRAQIQHLRAYGDPTVTTNNLARALVDPRFTLVHPKGKAPNVSDLAGTWASDPAYGTKLNTMYTELRRHAGIC